MLPFSNFLSEAKVSKNNLNKVADIFKRIFEKEFKTKLYRFGGPVGFTELKKGLGILYFYDRNKAIRLNYINGAIESITLWRSFKLGKSGDYTIDLGGLGLMQAGKHVLALIRSPSTGKIGVYPDLQESLLLSEAKRISPSAFFELIQKNLPPSARITSLGWDTIADIALANDFQIPTAVKSKARVPGTKGKFTKFDLTKLLDDSADADKPAKDVEPIYYLKLTAQDPNSKKFLSVKGDKKAENLLKSFAAVANEPNYKEEMKDADSLFGIMRNLTQVVCRGSRNSLIVYGGPGIGKTFVITQTIQDEGLQKNKDWFTIKGKITTSALYQTLFMHRKGSLLVFDDTDSVWGDAEAANILKAALDSYEERVISWVSPRTVNVSLMSDEEKEEFNDNIDLKIVNDPGGNVKLPSEFVFNGRIIFISNLPYEKFDTAVLNRSAKIDMTLTDEQVFARMKSILPNLGDKSVPVNIKEEILEFLYNQNSKGLLQSAPSMRTFVAAEDLYRSGMENWKELLDYV